MKYELESRLIAVGDTAIKLFVPGEGSVKQVYHAQRETNPVTPFPYWAKVWPAALALSTFLQKEPHYILGKNVLELAAGLGLPSLLAARYASTVCCSDYLPETLDVVRQSIALNGAANVSTRLLDWRRLPGDLAPEVLLLSD
ncbi:MAG TPA: methyltransferase, partial [Flavisolibacter sp.]